MAKKPMPYAGGHDMQPPGGAKDGRKTWWCSPVESAGRDLVSTVRSVLDDQQGYQAACERHYRMYRSMSLLGALPQSLIMPALNRVSQAFNIPASLNIVRPLVNTITSMASLNRPKGYWDTEGANRKTREQAKMLERVQDTLMFDLEGYQRTEEWVHSASLFGTGFVKTFAKDGKPCIDPVFTPEIVVDPMEGMYRAPRNMYRHMFVDRYVLCDMFPDHREQLMGSPAASDLASVWWAPMNASKGSMIPVYEGTHLPSHKGGDGCVVLAAGDVTLSRDKYTRTKHMYHPLRWSLVPHMYQGMGIPEEVLGIQIEINRLVRQIQAAIKFSNPMVLADANSAVNFDAFTSGQGLPKVSYVNHAPQIVVPQTVHQELFTFLSMLYQRAFETVGMNQLAAMGQAPKRFASGRAQSINMDIQNSRFAWFLRNYERGVLDVQLALLEIAREENYQAKVYDRRAKAFFDWKGFDFDETKFLRRPWAGSLLGSSPQEKRDAIDWYRANGLVTEKEQLLELADTPDLDKFTRRTLAGSRFIEDELQAMLDGGPYRAPPTEVNLQKGVALAQEMLLEAYADQVPSEDRVKVQKWIKHAMRIEEDRAARKQKMLELQALAQAGAAGPPGGLPPSLPEGPAPTMAGPQAPPPVGPDAIGAALQGVV